MTIKQRMNNDIATMDKREVADMTLKDNRMKNDELTKERRFKADEAKVNHRIKNDEITDHRRKVNDGSPSKTLAVFLFILVFLVLAAVFLLV